MKNHPNIVGRIALIFLLPALVARSAAARWTEAANDLPAWAQRGRVMFLRWDDRPLLPEFKQWQPVIHLHGARNPGKQVTQRDALELPTSLRVESQMFFGDDRAVNKVRDQFGGRGYVEHTWYWQYNWWLRDPAFQAAALIKRDGTRMVEYLGNRITERESGNPLNPLLARMRHEIAEAVLSPHDASSPANPFYPNFPYTPYDDTTYGQKTPLEYYPVFGHLSMLWYDNPTFWADSSPLSREIWRRHFQEKFGADIADPATDPDPLVQREWIRFWADAYGDYLDDYYRTLQRDVAKSAVPATTTGLNGKSHLTVGLNASLTGVPWGAQLLYLFHHHKISDFPGLLVEYTTQFTGGKRAPEMKFAMAAMQGHPTGGSQQGATLEAEALALNGADALVGITDRTHAYLQFQYDNRALLTNAMQGNRIGIPYNTRSGLVTNTLVNAYELGGQLDELGLPYDVLVEDDLDAVNADWLSGYAAILVPGGEYNAPEIEGLRTYVRRGGRLMLLGDAEIEPPQFLSLSTPRTPPAFRADVSLASAWGRQGFTAGESRYGAGTVWVHDSQIASDAVLEAALGDRLRGSYRVLDSRTGLVTCNVLRQPRQGDARLLGLVNYSGELQSSVKLALPEGYTPEEIAVISPDGAGSRLTAMRQGGQLIITVPELYNYALVVAGPRAVVEDALRTVSDKIPQLVACREPLQKVAPNVAPWIGRDALRPDSVPAGQRLARLRHGSNESGTFLALDALAPERATVGKPFRIQMKVLDTGSHYPQMAFLEYWRAHLVNIDNGEEVHTVSPGGNGPIEGAPLWELREGETVPPPTGAQELIGRTLVADFTVPKPGRYQVYIDYYYHNRFLQGDPGPAVAAAFPGDRPARGLIFPQTGMGKLFLQYKLPRLVVDVDAPPAPLRAQFYPVPWFEGDCSYHGAYVASSGKVYFTVSSHMAGQAVHLYEFDPTTQKVRLLWTAADTVKADGAVTQGKVHSPLREWNGEIYLATHDAWYYRDHTDPATGRVQRPYPGGYVLAINIRTGRGRIVASPLHGRAGAAYVENNHGEEAVPLEGESLLASIFDTGRGQFYALSWPGAHLIRVDVKSGNWHDYGAMQLGAESVPKWTGQETSRRERNPEQQSVLRTLGLDDEGNVYGSARGGRIWKYDARTDAVTWMRADLREGSGREIPPAYAANDYWRTVVWDPRERVFYGVFWATSWLFRFDPRADTVRPVRAWRAETEGDTVAPDLAQLGLALGPGHTLYGLVHAPRLTPDAKRSVHLLTYSLDGDHTFQDHGAVAGEDGANLMFNESCAVAPNGDVYAVGWMAAAPEERAALKIRREQGPPETRGYGYRMALVRIPARAVGSRE